MEIDPYKNDSPILNVVEYIYTLATLWSKEGRNVDMGKSLMYINVIMHVNKTDIQEGRMPSVQPTF